MIVKTIYGDKEFITNTQAQKLTLKHTHWRTNARTNAQSHTQMHARTLKSTHAHLNARTHTLRRASIQR